MLDLDLGRNGPDPQPCYLPGGADVTDPVTGLPIKIRMKRGPKKKKLKEMKTKRSKIWLYFTLKDDDLIAECNECQSRYENSMFVT